jgi:hypothetical protein
MTEYLVNLTVTTSVAIYVKVDEAGRKKLSECDHDFIEAGLISDDALLTALSRTMHGFGALDITQDDYTETGNKGNK